MNKEEINRKQKTRKAIKKLDSVIFKPTTTQFDDQQSLTLSYAQQLCSFPWLTAAGHSSQNIVRDPEAPKRIGGGVN